jgi:predicted metal-binding membrane protein
MTTAFQLPTPARRPAWGFLAALVALSALGWAWSLQIAGAGHHGLPLWGRVLMWTTMMVGMMVPPEVPTLVRLAQEGSGGRWRAAGSAAALLGGYLVVWVLASVGLAMLDARLGAWGLMTHDMASRSVALNVVILGAAGLAQLSPWKSACLERCRSIPRRLRDGAARPLGSGLRHGVASVSSCGVLMLVLLVVGAMNWVAMLLLTALLVAERLAPAGVSPLPSRVSGVGLLGWAGWAMLSAGLR